jgi:hypothetical protein
VFFYSIAGVIVQDLGEVQKTENPEPQFSKAPAYPQLQNTLLLASLGSLGFFNLRIRAMVEDHGVSPIYGFLIGVRVGFQNHPERFCLAMTTPTPSACGHGRRLLPA